MTLPRIWHIIKSKMITGPERRTLMIYILPAFCAVLVYVFLETAQYSYTYFSKKKLRNNMSRQ